MRATAFAALLIAAATAAHASAEPATPPPVLVAPAPREAAAKGPPSFDQVLAIMDKLFPPQPDPDPARLALSRTSVQAMWPDGAYGKMMTGFMSGMFDRMMQLKASDLPEIPGKAPNTTAAKDRDLSVKEQIAGKDPYFDQRMAAMREVINDEVGKISAIIDPRMRDGLARAMARRFDARQLGDINAFFATPSGHALASQYMQLWLDPDTLRSIFGSMPEMMKLVPELAEKFKAANDKFPKPPEALKNGKH
jgi:hypothetical protein